MTENSKKDLNGSAANAALSYLAMGFEPLVLPFKEKTPRGKWKERREWTSDSVRDEFGGRFNVGIALGKRSGDLVDLDFDCREAAELAKIVFADLPSFGRASSPFSHRVAKAKLKKGRLVFQLTDDVAQSIGADRAMLLEVRGNGHQTMFPPSLHPSGEVVTWHDDPSNIPEIDGGELARRCGLLAFLSATAMHYPRVAGERDEVALMISGVLVRCDLPDDQIDTLVVAVAMVAGDEEAEKRGGKAAASREKFEAGEPVWGLPELCKRLGMEGLEQKMREWLRLSGAACGGDNRPRILVRAGYLPEEVDKAESALLKGELGIFQRGEHLVRVVCLPQSDGAKGIKRSGGIQLINTIKKPWLKEQFAKVVRWFRPGEDTDIRINPPTSHASALLARVGEWNAPVLHGVVSGPTMRKDATILQSEGYDPLSGLLYISNGVEFPTVPDAPTREDAVKALAVLRAPFRDFQFATPADSSVAMSALLTSFIRRNLPSAPLFAIDAPTAGSGKSLLCETVGIIATGHKPTMISQGRTDDESEKRIFSVLKAGDPIVVFDNCDRKLGGDTLCSVLTQEIIASRILGKSEAPRLMTNTLFMATGNNIQIEGDLGRRTLMCRIDTGAERPDQIEHDFSPVEEATRNRPQLVVAGLTILRAYEAAGRPNPMVPMGSFESWNMVREAIVWLGEADPCTTRERVIADDPRKGDLAELLELWVDALGSKPTTLAEISEAAGQYENSKITLLQGALAERTYKGTFNTRSVGRYLGQHKDRVVGGRVLRCVDDPSGVKRYRVDTIGQPGLEDMPF
ncbi:bifunctional DNA primase/polymerase [uncultured Roseobacter sp.]|uniref:bifunctional DNA primase/polymerase n=1 Tax=uncultured Roseobacter sp. TaxID=114847 RepID=UPI00262E3544|nr:bifunctional DNA primase/polymerase [uncultured Roseobacter sp.]